MDASHATANRSTLAAAAVGWIASCAQVDTIADADKRGLAMMVQASALHAQCDDVSVL